MNILVINGSPKGEKSDTLKITRAFLEGMGETAEIVDTMKIDVKPCLGCFACWSRTPGKCVQQDDMEKVLKRITQADLVIWSKSSYPNFFMSSYNNKEMIIRSVRENNLRIILGFPYKEMTDGERENHNSAGFIDRDGSISLYHKIQIVPFGEFIPYTDLFPFLEDIAPEVGITQVPGTLKDPFVLSKNGRDYKFYPTICYEGIFTYLFHEMRQRGAEFFINITNDSYYDTTYEPRMHLYLNVFRAVEYNVQLFRASSTGISAIINPEGEIVKKIPLNAEGMIDANLVVPTKKTFYEVFGYYVIMTLRIILSYCLLLGALYFFADKIIIRIRNAKNPDNTDI